jgi:hypothetical protein
MGITLVDGYGMPKLVALTRNKHTKDLLMTTLLYEDGLLYISVGIGDLPGLDLEEARQLANDLLGMVAHEEAHLLRERASNEPLGPPAYVHPYLQGLIDGLPLPDGRVLRPKPEVLAAEKAFFESLEASDPTPKVCLDEFPPMSEECAQAIGILLAGACKEQSTAAPPSPVDPGLLLGIRFVLDDAAEALDDITDRVADAQRSISTAVENIDEIEEDIKRWNIATDMPTNEALGKVFGSFPDMPLPGDEYGGGGMSADAIKLDDAFHTIKRLLHDDLVSVREVDEFTNAVERLIRR